MEKDMMPLAEYARMHGQRPDNARHLAKEGRFKTAYKIGRDWVVDRTEPWPTNRRAKKNEVEQ